MEGSPDIINSHMSVTKMILQIRYWPCSDLVRDGFCQVYFVKNALCMNEYLPRHAAGAGQMNKESMTTHRYGTGADDDEGEEIN